VVKFVPSVTTTSFIPFLLQCTFPVTSLAVAPAKNAINRATNKICFFIRLSLFIVRIKKYAVKIGLVFQQFIISVWLSVQKQTNETRMKQLLSRIVKSYLLS